MTTETTSEDKPVIRCLPVRSYASLWRAVFDGHEPGDPQGTGPSEKAAIADLLSQAERVHAEREELRRFNDGSLFEVAP